VILKTFRLRARYGPPRIKNHVARGDENEEIIYVQGEERDLDDMWNDALARGKEYAARHVIIAPEKDTTLEAMLELMQRFCEEFGIDIRRGFIRAHKKPRRIESAHDYLHGVFPEWDDETGKMIDSKMSYWRQELLARVWEHDNKQPPLHGDHHRWVVGELVVRKRPDVAEWLLKAFPYDATRTIARRKHDADAQVSGVERRRHEGRGPQALAGRSPRRRLRPQFPRPDALGGDAHQARYWFAARVDRHHHGRPLPRQPCWRRQRHQRKRQ
jgi:hypothetical protein